jgi:hypothetical protein
MTILHCTVCCPVICQVTSKKEQEKYWTDESKTYEYIPVARMVKKFQESEVGQEITNYLATPYNRASSHQYALVTTNFALSKWELLKACTEREWLLIKRNKFIYIFRTCQVLNLIHTTLSELCYQQIYSLSTSKSHTQGEKRFEPISALIYLSLNKSCLRIELEHYWMSLSAVPECTH